jgi:hypothetical protein
MLPDEVLAATRAQPGDGVAIEVVDPNTIVLRFRRVRLAEAEGEQAGPIGIADLLPGHGNEPVDYDSLPRLTLEELLQRYPIEGPVDLKADREAIYDEMAKDVFGERRDRFSP